MKSMSTRHLLFFIPAVVIVPSKTYQTLFTKYGQRDSWIAMTIALVIVYAFITFIIWVCKKKNCFDMVEIYRGAFGKVMGNILLVFFYMTVFLTLLETTSVESAAMKYQFINFNPYWGFLLLSVVAGLYIILLGYRSVLVVVSIGIIFISVSGVSLAVQTHKFKDYSRLLPILEYGLNQDFIRCVIMLVGSLASLVILVPLFKDVRDKKNLMRMNSIGYAFSAQIHIFAITGSLATFEPALANTYPFTKLTQTERIMHFGFLETGELFVMLQIVGGWVVRFVTTFFVFDQMLRYMSVKKRGLNILISVLVFVVSYLMGRNLFNLFKYLNIYVYISFVNFFIIPLLTFTVFAILRKRVPKTSN